MTFVPFHTEISVTRVSSVRYIYDRTLSQFSQVGVDVDVCRWTISIRFHIRFLPQKSCYIRYILQETCGIRVKDIRHMT